jgi:predicted dehydrogenase
MVYTVSLFGVGNAGFNNGCDPMRLNPASHFHAISQCPQLKLTAVIDPDERKKDLLLRAGYCGDLFPNVDSFLASTVQTDIVVVASPTSTHSYLSTEVIEHKTPLALLCEKPGSSNVRELKNVINLAKKNKVLFWINYFRRWDSTMRDLVNEIRSEISLLEKVICIYNNGLSNYAVHMIDFLIWLIPGWALKSSEACKDNPSFALVHPNGIRAELIGIPNHVDYDLFTIVFFLKNRVVKLDAGGIVHQEFVPVNGLYYSNYQHLQLEKDQRKTLSGFRPIYADLVNCLIHGKESKLYDPADAIAVMKLVEQVYPAELVGG